MEGWLAHKKNHEFWGVLDCGILRLYDRKHNGNVKFSVSVTALRSVQDGGDTLLLEFTGNTSTSLLLRASRRPDRYSRSPSLSQWARTLTRLFEATRTGYLLYPLAVTQVVTPANTSSSIQMVRRAEVISLTPLNGRVWCVASDFVLSEWDIVCDAFDLYSLVCTRSLLIDQSHIDIRWRHITKGSICVQSRSGKPSLLISAGNGVGSLTITPHSESEISWCSPDECHTNPIRCLLAVRRSHDDCPEGWELWSFDDVSIHIWQVDPNGSLGNCVHVINIHQHCSILSAIQVHF